MMAQKQKQSHVDVKLNMISDDQGVVKDDLPGTLSLISKSIHVFT